MIETREILFGYCDSSVKPPGTYLFSETPEVGFKEEPIREKGGGLIYKIRLQGNK